MNALRALAPALLGLLAAALPASGQALEQLQDRLVGLSAKVRPSVVAVTAYAEDGGEEYLAARFSGILLDARGHVLTVADEIGGRKRILVKLLDGRTLEARAVGADPLTNVGVLRIEAPGLSPVAPAPGGGRDLPVGSLVIAVGNPFGLNHSVSMGLVSGTDRTLVLRENRLVRGMIQTTAPINPGDAGGLLADLQGRFVGMLSSTFGRSPSMHGVKAMLEELALELNRDPEFKAAVTDTIRLLFEGFGKGSREDLVKRFEDIQRLMRRSVPEASGAAEQRPAALGAVLGTEGINFAVPAAVALDVAGRLIRDGRVVRGQIGMRGLSLSGDPYHRHKYEIPEGVSGILVASLLPEGPAARAGVQRFDVVQALAGEAIEDPLVLMEKIYSTAPGTRVKLRVWRKDSDVREIEVEVGEMK